MKNHIEDFQRDLLHAGKQGNIALAQEALHHGALLSHKNYASFRWAAKKGHADFVRWMSDFYCFKRDNLVLHQIFFDAARYGHLNCLKVLDKNLSQDVLNRSLMVSAGGGYQNCVDFLLEKGADPQYEDSEALERAAKEGHLVIVEKLIPLCPRKDIIYALGKAVASGQEACVDFLLFVVGSGQDLTNFLISAVRNHHRDIALKLCPYSNLQKISSQLLTIERSDWESLHQEYESQQHKSELDHATPSISKRSSRYRL